MSISGISSSALQTLLDSAFTPTSTNPTSSIGQTSSADAVTSSTSSNTAPASTTDSSLDPVTQDLVSLLKALASGDTAGAKSDLTKLQHDLKSESASSTSAISKDLTSLLKDLGSGDAAAAKADLSKLTKDVKAEETSAESASASASATTQNPLDKLVSTLSDLLKSGSTDGALQAVAGYLVNQGQEVAPWSIRQRSANENVASDTLGYRTYAYVPHRFGLSRRASNVKTGGVAFEKNAICICLPETQVAIHCVSSEPHRVFLCRNRLSPGMLSR